MNVEDGSGKGAAIVAAIAQRLKRRFEWKMEKLDVNSLSNFPGGIVSSTQSKQNKRSVDFDVRYAIFIATVN